MPTSQFDVVVRHVGDTAVLDLHGEINGGAAAQIRAAYAEATAAGAPRVLLNFGGVDYINSTGIALIVGLLASARAEQRVIQACNLAPHYLEIFTITRLSDFMSIFPDEATAVGDPAAI